MASTTDSQDLTVEAAARAALSRRPLERARVQSLLSRMEPGSTLVSIRRLKGGISTRTADVLYVDSQGSRKRAVVRVSIPENYHSDAESVERTWKTLQALEHEGIAAPAPMFLDLGGEHFGSPTMVISRLPGGPLPLPRSPSIFLAQLAEALAALHRLGPQTRGLEHLKTVHRAWMEEVLGGEIHTELAGIPLAEEAFALMKARLPGVHWDAPVLTHDDFWPGNSVWQRGRLSGIVDWSTAEFGDPRTDVAQCRVDLTMMYGPGWADEFARCYESAGGASLRDLWFWDLARGLSSRRQVHHFVEGYRDYGLRDLTLEVARGRLEAFLRQAMAAAPA